MFPKIQVTVASAYFILLLFPIFVLGIPNSLSEETEKVYRNRKVEQTQMAFKNLHGLLKNDSADEKIMDSHGCNHIPVEDTCTLLDPRQCCDIYSLSGVAAFVCRPWEPSCSANLCPTRLYFNFLSDTEAKTTKDKKWEIRDIL